MAYRTFKRHLTASDRRAKAIIEACAESGAGIESLPDAPRFRFTPLEKNKNSFEPNDTWASWKVNGKPSGRGSIACGRGNPLKLKNWTPTKLDLNPQYRVPMTGDCEDLRHARYQWAEGNPRPLRAYLEKQATERRKAQSYGVQLELAA